MRAIQKVASGRALFSLNTDRFDFQDGPGAACGKKSVSIFKERSGRFVAQRASAACKNRRVIRGLYPQLADFSTKAAERSWPWLKSTHAIVNFLRREGPINPPIIFFQRRRQCRQRIILGNRCERSIFESA